MEVEYILGLTLVWRLTKWNLRRIYFGEPVGLLFDFKQRKTDGKASGLGPCEAASNPKLLNLQSISLAYAAGSLRGRRAGSLQESPRNRKEPKEKRMAQEHSFPKPGPHETSVASHRIAIARK
jgi:hypothetical protein